MEAFDPPGAATSRAGSAANSPEVLRFTRHTPCTSGPLRYGAAPSPNCRFTVSPTTSPTSTNPVTIECPPHPINNWRTSRQVVRSAPDRTNSSLAQPDSNNSKRQSDRLANLACSGLDAFLRPHAPANRTFPQTAMSREHIPSEVRRPVLVEAGHRCAIPTCGATTTEVAHIVPWAKTQDNSPQNLIALCPNCHTRYDCGEIDRPAMRIYKQNLGIVNHRYAELERRIFREVAKSGRRLFILGAGGDLLRANAITVRLGHLCRSSRSHHLGERPSRWLHHCLHSIDEAPADALTVTTCRRSLQRPCQLPRRSR